MNPALRAIIAAETSRNTFPAATAFGAHLQKLYGAATTSVVFYGSCLRQSTDEGLLLDFYVLVDSYNKALRHVISAAGARLLPPNVYYHEMPFEDRTLRAKVAVIAVDQFLYGLSPQCFASSLWARFAQPALILYARNEEVRRRLNDALASAAYTMILRARPLIETPYTARDLWIHAFSATYGAELRPEKDNKGAELVDAELARYTAITQAILDLPASDGTYVPVTPVERRAALGAWRLRRMQGRTLNALRLIKAAFTFKGGIDYAVWKIERHSGVKIELTPAERKRPLITGIRLFLKTMRRGGLR
jgi:hypothetical protein